MRILSNLNVSGFLDIDTITNAAADTDKFLVADANGVVRFRTGAEVASDIGASVGYVSTVKHEVKLGEAINKGQAVYVSTSDGTNMIVMKASNVTDAASSKTMGLIETSGAINAKVNVITEGLLAGLDTSMANAGDAVWLGTNGNLVYGLINKPVAPAHMVFIGIVTRSNINNGEIFIKVQNGFELEELHNVLITGTPVDKAVIQYDTASGLWKNSDLGGVTASTGTAGQVAYFTGATTQGGSNNLFWDTTNLRLGIGTNAPSHPLNILSTNAALGFRLEHATPSSASFPFQITNSADTNYIRANVNVIEFARNGGASTIRTKGSNNELLLQSLRHLQLAVNDGTIAAQLYSTGNLVLQNGGTFTDSGQRLQVIGDTLLKGSGNTSATTALTVQNSDGNNILRLRNDFTAIFDVAGSSLTISGIANYTILQANQAFYFRSNGATAGRAFKIFDNASSLTGTTGANQNIQSLITFAPTSGTATYTDLDLTSTINQTGGANGITRGLYVRPTLTAAADWRSIEWSNNSGWGLYGAGTANNYMAGDLRIGSTSDITGVSKIFTSFSSQVAYGITFNNTYTAAVNNGYFLRAYNNGTEMFGINFQNETTSNPNIAYRNSLTFSNGLPTGTERMRLDASGNLGLGVTPSAWGGPFKVMQLGTYGQYIAGQTNNADMKIGMNSYYNGTNYIYTNSGSVTLRYDFSANGYAWQIAPSGTAGNAITFTQAMTLDASGNLGVGTASPYANLDLGKSGANNIILRNTSNAYNLGYIGNAGGRIDIGFSNSNGSLVTLPYLSVTSLSNVLIGSTSDTGEKFQVTGTAKITGATTIGGGSSATSQLDVTSNSNANGITLRNRTGNDYAFFIWRSLDGSELLAESYIERTAANTATLRHTINNGSGVANYLTIASTGAATFSNALTVTGNLTVDTNTLFVDATNNRVGIVTASPSAALHVVGQEARFGGVASGLISVYNSVNRSGYLQANNVVDFRIASDNDPMTFYVGGSERMRISTAGNLLIGSTSDTTEKLQVTGTAKITGILSLGSNLSVLNGFTINSAGSNNLIGAQTTQGAAILAISNIYTSSRLTAGTQSTVDITNTFNPTSGPALHHFLNLTFTVNQTGGANGITRGIYLNATLTAAADFRGIEWTNNTGWGLYGVGSASNYLQGSLGIGTASINASAKLQVDSTTQGFLPPRMTATQRSAISSPSVGLVVYQTDGVEGLYIYTNTNGWKSLAIVN